ncbi:MAG: Asp-tRNA(Asn)/Glu-tRNA(Gln) amidotransferase subunit GatB [Candidatus Peribacteraceae bacterium]|nr:Asp-tRNA(Asn)/Glu-tRNA(Gln) amidotransferase subunit GatB [Candidatus Peribacteraceae bacterium]
MTKELEVIIGLEVHAQMNTKTKMFCGCDNDAWNKSPNTTVCPICMGHPGTLPVPNRSAIEKAITASLALGAAVQPDNHLDRKHYFYPDLPAGFQISQYDFPLAKGGSVPYVVADASGKTIEERTCRLIRLHVENDAGKLSHYGDRTLCDYNRAGTPLMEIVTEPDLRSAQDAVAFTQELRRILIAVNASDAEMFKGMMRFDASISLREKGSKKLNPRSEIKNLNSFKSLEKALTYEGKRLADLWAKDGGPLPHDITVGWLDDEEQTRMLRDKETATDYRYFPEPDIPPMQFSAKDIEKIRKDLPPLPRELKACYASLGLTDAEVNLLVNEPVLRRLFDAVHGKTGDAKRASSIVLTQLVGFLNAYQKGLHEAPSPERLLALIASIDAATISANTGKDVLEKMVKKGVSATDIIASEGLKQISDSSTIEAAVDRAIAENPKAIESYKKGKNQALGAIVGWVMKETKGQANPGMVNEILKKKIG